MNKIVYLKIGDDIDRYIIKIFLSEQFAFCLSDFIKNAKYKVKKNEQFWEPSESLKSSNE